MTTQTHPNRALDCLIGPGSHLVERVALGTERCRCGNRPSAGDSCFEFAEIDENLTGLLRGEVFCSLVCVRAYALEAIEVLHASAAPALIRDYQEVYSFLTDMAISAEDELLAVSRAE